MQHNKQHKPNKNFTRVNFQIRALTVRVTQEGQQLGVMPIAKARQLAQDAGLDLVEIAPTAQPPVCAILDYGKFKYEAKVREKEQRRKQRESTIQLKELRLRPAINDHDIETKSKAARKFLEEGMHVQLNLQFKNREITHKDQGFKVINKVIDDVKDIAAPDRLPKMEGNRLVCRLIPKDSDNATDRNKQGNHKATTKEVRPVQRAQTGS